MKLLQSSAQIGMYSKFSSVHAAKRDGLIKGDREE
jgi:hypothetical protein